MDKKNINV